jgi:hypothetical protein
MEPVNELDSDIILYRLRFLKVPECQFFGVVYDKNSPAKLIQIACNCEA